MRQIFLKLRTKRANQINELKQTLQDLRHEQKVLLKDLEERKKSSEEKFSNLINKQRETMAEVLKGSREAQESLNKVCLTKDLR